MCELTTEVAIRRIHAGDIHHPGASIPPQRDCEHALDEPGR